MDNLMLTVLLGASLVIFLKPSPAYADICHRDSALSKARMLEGIKQEILLRLGLEEEPVNPPNSTNDTDIDFLKKYSAVKKAQELNHEHKPCASLDFHTKEIEVFQPTDVDRKKPAPRSAAGDGCAVNSSVDFYNSYNFTFLIDLRGKDFITDAKLQLKKSLLYYNSMSSEDRIVSKDRVDVYFITRPAAIDYFGGEYYPRFTTAAFLDPADLNGLAVFNVTNAIIWWLEMQEHAISHMGEIEFEIFIRCPQPLTHRMGFIPNFQFFTESHNEGRLVITTYQDKANALGFTEHARRKRQDINDDLTFCVQDQLECCLERLRINFRRDFNWTWVIMPKEIAFNYCSGECPVEWGRLATKHAQLLDLLRYRAQRNPAAAPEPCCVPNSYLSVPLAINLRGTRSMELLEDFVATTCACR